MFVVNPKATIAWKKREDIPDNFEIDFVYKDATYKKSVDLFGLKSRYNTDCLMEALRWLDKKTDSHLRCYMTMQILKGAVKMQSVKENLR